MEQKNEINKYFSEMLRNVSLYKLSIDQYKIYFKNLNTAIDNNLLTNSLKYLNALLSAEISPILTNHDEELIANMRLNLKNKILTIKIKEEIENKIDLNEYFNKMEKIIDTKLVPISYFCEHVDMLALAFSAKVDNINITEYCRILLNANVLTKSYDEKIKVNKYKQRLSSYIISGIQSKSK